MKKRTTGGHITNRDRTFLSVFMKSIFNSGASLVLVAF